METSAQVWRRWKRALGAIAALYVLVLVVVFGWYVHRQSVHMRWYRRIEYLILSLAPKRPANVTPQQWAQCLTHTWNLHVNFGPSGYFAESERERFAAEFDDRLEGTVSLDTIDWVWDEFARHAPGSRSYMRYRPTTTEMLEGASELPNEEPLDWWIEQFQQQSR